MPTVPCTKPKKPGAARWCITKQRCRLKIVNTSEARARAALHEFHAPKKSITTQPWPQPLTIAAFNFTMKNKGYTVADLSKITCIEDLRQVGRVPRAAHVLRLCRLGLVDPRHLPCQRKRSSDIKFRQRVAVNMEGRSTAHHHGGRKQASMPAWHRPDGADRHAARRWRNLAARAAEEVWHSLHALDHEHLLHGRHCRAHHRAVLVSAVHDARPRGSWTA